MDENSHTPWIRGTDVLSSSLEALDELFNVIVPIHDPWSNQSPRSTPTSAMVSIVDKMLDKIMEDRYNDTVHA